MLDENNPVRIAFEKSRILVTMKAPSRWIDHAYCCFGCLREVDLWKLITIAGIEI